MLDLASQAMQLFSRKIWLANLAGLARPQAQTQRRPGGGTRRGVWVALTI
jgi:hypothetical protein